MVLAIIGAKVAGTMAEATALRLALLLLSTCVTTAMDKTDALQFLTLHMVTLGRFILTMSTSDCEVCLRM